MLYGLFEKEYKLGLLNVKHVFKRSGLAALSDLASPEYQKIFSKLETEQDVFLGIEAEFRSPEYRWPRDALHSWDGIWEYPYVYYHMENQAAELGPDSERKVVDLGSGVTFFPFSVAKLGYHVYCLDIDATCGLDIERAAAAMQHQPDKVDFRLISDGRFPLKDGEVDTVYCISVLEHIPDFENIKNAIEEVFRVLKPNGLFILTIDLDLCGYMDIGTKKYCDLRQCLDEYFDLKEAEITVHPLDMLQPRNGPFPYMTYSTWQKCKFHVKQWIKPLLGKRRFYSFPNITEWGAVMTKRSKM